MKTLVQKGHGNCNCKHGSGAAEGPSLQTELLVTNSNEEIVTKCCKHPHRHSIAHLFAPKDGPKMPFRHR